MKYIIISLFSVYCLVLFQSCSNDDIPLEDVETSIAYQITCDDPNAQMHIIADGLGIEGVYVKESFSNKLKTKSDFAVIEVSCNNPTALIRIDLYVGKKHITEYGNSKAFLSERLKGKGPYLE